MMTDVFVEYMLKKKFGPKDMLAVNTLELEKRCLMQDGFIITII